MNDEQQLVVMLQASGHGHLLASMLTICRCYLGVGRANPQESVVASLPMTPAVGYRADTLTLEAIQQHNAQEHRVAVLTGKRHGAHVIELCFLPLRCDSGVHRQHGKQALNTKKALKAFTQCSSTDRKRFQNGASTPVARCQS